MSLCYLFKQYRGQSKAFKLFMLIRWFFSPYKELARNIPANCKVVDVGCGHGIFANYLSMVTTRDVYGIDISKQRIKSAKESVGSRPNISFLLEDISMAGLPKCDFVTMIDFLHHLPPSLQEDVIKKSFAALTSGGVIMIKEVDVRPRWKYYYNYIVDFLTGIYNITEGTAQHYRSSEDFKSLLTKFGFKNVMISHIKKIDPAPHVIIKGEKYDEKKC